MSIDNDRKRPFLEEPVYHGCPISWAERFFQGKVSEFRKANIEFDLFLIGIEQEIKKRKITYCDNILLLINGGAKVNWISPKKSLFRTLIKLYNYDFSPKQAVDHIEQCYTKYKRLLNDELEMGNDYELFTARIRWDSSMKDFVKLTLSPKRKNLLILEPYWIRVCFCSMQIERSDYPYNGYPDDDNKIDLIADESTYEDALSLFDYCNGNHFARRIMDITIKKLIENKIISKQPDETVSKYSKTHLFTYSVNVKRYLKLKEDKGW